MKLRQLCRLLRNLAVLSDYVMEQWQTDRRPPEIIKALCEIHWPGRRFEIDEDAGDGLFYLRDARDVDTGEIAEELLREEFRQGTFPRYFKPLLPGTIQLQVEVESLTQTEEEREVND